MFKRSYRIIPKIDQTILMFLESLIEGMETNEMHNILECDSYHVLL